MTEERRRFFRINDSMGVSYRVLGEEEAKAYIRRSKQQDGSLDIAANFDNRIQTLLDACKIQSPVAAELIDLVNKKLNLVIQQSDIDSSLIHNVAYTVKKVNASACGLAFGIVDKLKIGQLLQLDIQLLPSDLNVTVLAEVVGCDPVEEEELTEDSKFFARFNFTEINNNDQELLIQHIVKRQAALLKHQR